MGWLRFWDLAHSPDPAAADVTSANPLPVTGSVADGGNVALGATDDSAATSDTGTFSLIALFKRLLQRLHLGVANIAVSHVATSGTAGTLAIARPTRRRLTIKNMDGTITVYIGPATVTAANGFELKAGQSTDTTWVGLVQVIAASGTPTVCIMDEYD